MSFSFPRIFRETRKTENGSVCPSLIITRIIKLYKCITIRNLCLRKIGIEFEIAVWRRRGSTGKFAEKVVDRRHNDPLEDEENGAEAATVGDVEDVDHRPRQVHRNRKVFDLFRTVLNRFLKSCYTGCRVNTAISSRAR